MRLSYYYGIDKDELLQRKKKKEAEEVGMSRETEEKKRESVEAEEKEKRLSDARDQVTFGSPDCNPTSPGRGHSAAIVRP